MKVKLRSRPRRTVTPLSMWSTQDKRRALRALLCSRRNDTDSELACSTVSRLRVGCVLQCDLGTNLNFNCEMNAPSCVLRIYALRVWPAKNFGSASSTMGTQPVRRVQTNRTSWHGEETPLVPVPDTQYTTTVTAKSCRLPNNPSPNSLCLRITVSSKLSAARLCTPPVPQPLRGLYTTPCTTSQNDTWHPPLATAAIINR